MKCQWVSPQIVIENEILYFYGWKVYIIQWGHYIEVGICPNTRKCSIYISTDGKCIICSGITTLKWVSPQIVIEFRNHMWPIS